MLVKIQLIINLSLQTTVALTMYGSSKFIYIIRYLYDYKIKYLSCIFGLGRLLFKK